MYYHQVVWLTICTAAVGYMPEGDRKRHVVNNILRHCFSVLSSAISAVINYHNEENRPTTGICVANHTSPIDVLVLMCDTTYSLVSKLLLYMHDNRIIFMWSVGAFFTNSF